MNRIMYRTSQTAFSPTSNNIMDQFLKDPTIYYTPMTMYLTLDLDISSHTVKTCMSLLLKNSYLTKEGGMGTNHYSITKENMEFWVTDFRSHVLELEKLKQPKQLENLPIDNSEDDD